MIGFFSHILTRDEHCKGLIKIFLLELFTNILEIRSSLNVFFPLNVSYKELNFCYLFAKEFSLNFAENFFF